MLSTSNRALWRSLRSLIHPITILAVLTLLFNDHWLRWHYPSWLTGKLGDFAWLVFAPFIAVVVFSLIIPRRFKQQERWVGLIAFIVIGLWFTLGKTVPFVHILTTTALHAINGYPDSLRMDATDLLTLPALMIGWWIWTHTNQSLHLRRPLAYIVFGLGIMLTLANEPGPSDWGIRCVLEKDGQLLAVEGGWLVGSDVYVSDNGGATWDKANQPLALRIAQSDHDCSHAFQSPVFVITDPANQAVQYHFVPGVSIERSDDGGHSWKVEMDLSNIDTELHRFYEGQKQGADMMGFVNTEPGPFDAVFDQLTGNLIVAMGQDGILVRSTGGQWKWAAAGPYHLVTIEHPGNVSELLSTEFGLAIVLGILALGWLLPTINRGLVAQFFTVLGWLCWLLGVLIPPPKSPTGDFINNFAYLTTYTATFAGILGFILVLAAITQIITENLDLKKLSFRFSLTLLSVVLFLLPYVLWSQAIIPQHSTASLIALILVSSALLGGKQYMEVMTLKKKKTGDTVQNDLPA